MFVSTTINHQNLKYQRSLRKLLFVSPAQPCFPPKQEKGYMKKFERLDRAGWWRRYEGQRL